MTGEPLLEIDDLSIRFQFDQETVEAVRGVSLRVMPGETVGVVGESGSGKTMTAHAILRILPPGGRVVAGRIRFKGREVLAMDEASLLAFRGNDVAMIFQEPMTALNPLHTVGQQLGEALRLHRGLQGGEAFREGARLLAETGLDDPEGRMGSYPHQLSGGQRQRSMIAMALACDPELLIADEPTTALDVTIQAQILEVLQKLKAERNLALLLISHDLPMVRKMADRAYVMERGVVVEEGTRAEVFDHPRHPYTRKLLGSLPSAEPPPPVGETRVVLEARQVRCHFPIRRGFFRRIVGHVKAVDGVDLVIRRGETVGVVGESGSGKTTLGEALLGLIPATGERHFDGESLAHANRDRMRRLRRRMQVIFQDPFSSLSPRFTVREIVEEGLRIHEPGLDPMARRQQVAAMLTEVGLPGESILDRYPHEFSGGQRQRIAIARAMVLKPELLVLDEPTSALDLSVQGQVLALLRRLQRDHGLGYLFISHDLRVVRSLSHQVLVMLNGQVVERGETAELFRQPRHPYTKRLLAAALDLSVAE